MYLTKVLLMGSITQASHHNNSRGHRFCLSPMQTSCYIFVHSCMGIFSTIKLFTLLPHFHGGLCERHTRHKRTYSHIFRHTCRILYPYPLAFSSCHQEVVKEHNVKTRMSTHEVKVERKNTQSKRCCRSG